MKKTTWTLFWALGVAASARAQGAPASPAPPAEVRRTVDALAGHWAFDGTVVEGAAQPPAKVRMSIDCRRAARGMAVACTLVGDLQGFGPVEAASVVGYSPAERRVYWMEISSTGEYHAHRGVWKDDGIEFEPLVSTTASHASTERFSLRFPSPDRWLLRSVTETAEGSSTIEGVASRRPPRR